MIGQMLEEQLERKRLIGGPLFLHQPNLPRRSGGEKRGKFELL